VLVPAAAIAPGSSRWPGSAISAGRRRRPATCPGIPSSPACRWARCREPAGVHGAVLAPDDQRVAVLDHLVLGHLQVGEGLAEAGRTGAAPARTEGAGAGPASAPGRCWRRSALADVEDDLLGLDLAVFDQVEPGARRLHPVSERAPRHPQASVSSALRSSPALASSCTLRGTIGSANATRPFMYICRDRG
jgi:hypothetical protein